MRMFKNIMTALILFAVSSFTTATLAYSNSRISYISMPVNTEDSQWVLAGKLSYPLEQQNGAAVLIVHGSGGVDTRGAYHGAALNEQGFVTLEVDMWAARGWMGKQFGRPKGVPETLPDTFAALKFLSTLDGVDPERIGIMGFSWGGVVSMLTRSNTYLESFPKDVSFAANVAFYPVCWAYNKVPGYELVDVANSPLLILTGESDDYDTATSCVEWRSNLNVNDQNNIDIVVYPNSAHGFNTSAASATVSDPFSHQGKGGDVIMETNQNARELSNKAQLEFFLHHLNPQ